MRAAIGLLGLSLLGAFVPTGLRGMPYVAPVVASAAGALVLLLSGCVAFATFKPRGARPSASARSIVSPTARRPLNRVASAPSASRTV